MSAKELSQETSQVTRSKLRLTATVKGIMFVIGFSIIFITHDLNLLLQVADRICVLYNGELVDSGSVDKIKEGGSHDYTQALLNSIPQIDLTPKNIKNDKKVLSLNNINVKYQLGSWLFPEFEFHQSKSRNQSMLGSS